MSEVKAFATINQIQLNTKFIFHIAGNIVGKGEKTGYQHFLLFSLCFKKLFPLKHKVVTVWKMVTSMTYKYRNQCEDDKQPVKL